MTLHAMPSIVPKRVLNVILLVILITNQSEGKSACCDDVDSYEGLCCENGGHCKTNSTFAKEHADDKHYNPVSPQYCKCPNGFAGDTCNLNCCSSEVGGLCCENGGVCVIVDLDMESTISGELLGNSDPILEKCDCSPGFDGKSCEMTVEYCGDMEHKCYNGGMCVKAKDMGAPMGEYTYLCDCSTAGGDSSPDTYAGLYCENLAQSCHIKQKHHDKAYSYCANGGVCKEMVSKSQKVHKGCDCPEGYEGESCEYELGKNPFGTSSEDGEEEEYTGETIEEVEKNEEDDPVTSTVASAEKDSSSSSSSSSMTKESPVTTDTKSHFTMLSKVVFTLSFCVVGVFAVFRLFSYHNSRQEKIHDEWGVDGAFSSNHRPGISEIEAVGGGNANKGEGYSNGKNEDKEVI
eukprot:CAMPEP_0195510814 /NCGR_PEP_ID=MMETSP0794_2-20130614/3342_1 /TAXON_ID=515487 /ORGANISM="Stephanopyxis turris, Strain CCMP 815" /LENGTH=404 /DNA_ID=CAMNT_0040638307 /DNA_START=33 /DNA_END=1247 /DNA_ORIENTATION=+